MLLYIILICLTTCHAQGAEPSDSEKRIVGGTDAKLGEFPYQVSLRISGRHFCGGSIIYPDWVLTAAHCVDTLKANQFNVVVGTIKINEGSKYDVNSIFVNENYNKTSYQNDIALIKTKTSIKYQEPNIQNITLATKETPAGTKCLVSGWGRIIRNGRQPTNLKKVEINAISLESCQNIYKKYEKRNPITSSQICAYKAEGKGTCQGDSGGPLVCDSELVGLISYSVSCARAYPSVLTKVYAFRKWIEDTVNAN